MSRSSQNRRLSIPALVLALVGLAAGAVGCKSQETWDRTYDEGGQLRQERGTRTITIETPVPIPTMPGLQPSPYQVVPTPGSLAPPGTEIKIDPATGKPVAIIPGYPGVMFPLKELQSPSQTEPHNDSGKVTSEYESGIWTLSFEGTQDAIVGPDTKVPSSVQYSNNEGFETFVTKDHLALAGFLFSRGFTSFGEVDSGRVWGRVEYFTFIDAKTGEQFELPMGVAFDGQKVGLVPLVQ